MLTHLLASVALAHVLRGNFAGVLTHLFTSVALAHVLRGNFAGVLTHLFASVALGVGEVFPIEHRLLSGSIRCQRVAGNSTGFPPAL